eukprot:jgi/Bigna1/72851/fgenesh1_pg.21_\
MSQQLEEQQDFGSQAVQGHEQKQERKGDTDAKEGGGTPPQAPPGPAPGIKKADAAAEALENFYEADDEDVAAESKKVVMALRALRPRASNYAKLKVSIEYKYQTHDVWAAIMQDIMDYEADLPPEWAALFRNDGGLGASRGTTQSTVKQQQPVQRNTQFMSVKTAPVMITKYNGKRGEARRWWKNARSILCDFTPNPTENDKLKWLAIIKQAMDLYETGRTRIRQLEKIHTTVSGLRDVEAIMKAFVNEQDANSLPQAIRKYRAMMQHEREPVRDFATRFQDMIDELHDFNYNTGDDQARFEEFKLKIKESTYVTEKGYTTMEAAVQAISLREQEQDRKFTSPKVPGIGNINAIKPQRDWYKDREGNRRCGYCSRKGKHTAKDCRDRKEGRPRMTIRQLNEHYEKLKRKKGRGQGYNNSKWQGSNNGKNNKYKNKKQNSINAIQQQINGILDHLKQAPTKTAVPATQDQDKPMTLDDIKNLGVCNINDEDANRTIKVAMTKVKVKDSYGDYKKLPALWDSGSMPKSFISLSTVRRLGLLDQVTKKERKYAQADGSSSMKTVGELMLKLQIPGSDAETQIKTRVAMTLSMELLLGQDALEKLGGIISFYNHKIYFAKLPKKSGRTISQNMIRLDEWTSESSVNALEFMDLADNKLPTPTELRKKNPGKTIRQITELLDKTPPADDWDIDKGKKYINKILNEKYSDITKPTTKPSSKLTPVKIELKKGYEECIINDPEHRRPEADWEKIEWQINEWAKEGKIEPSNSPWNVRHVLAKKPTYPFFRLAHNFIRHNRVIKRIQTPTPRIDDVIEHQGRITPNPEKVAALQQAPKPKNAKELKSFLQTAAWILRRFSPTYARTAAAFTTAYRKENSVGLSFAKVWAKAGLDAHFDNLIKLCSNTLLNAKLDTTRPATLWTDWSKLGPRPKFDVEYGNNKVRVNDDWRMKIVYLGYPGLRNMERVAMKIKDGKYQLLYLAVPDLPFEHWYKVLGDLDAEGWYGHEPKDEGEFWVSDKGDKRAKQPRSRSGSIKLGKSSGPRIVTNIRTATKQQIITRHNFYMYEFRTKYCQEFPHFMCKQAKPYSCVKAHYENNIRRRPRLVNGKFNFTDKLCTFASITDCPNSMNCAFSHRVQKEHIYHPSLYKTQLCESPLTEDGICAEFGIHCAKAHGIKDLRQPQYEPDDPRALVHRSGSTSPNCSSDSSADSKSGEHSFQISRTFDENTKELKIHADYMYKFRVTRCLAHTTGQCQFDGNTCFHSHGGENSSRRIPELISGKFNYLPIRCQYMLKGKTCHHAQNCRFAHSKEEVIYHPSKYKTQLCPHRLKKVQVIRQPGGVPNQANESNSMDGGSPSADGKTTEMWVCAGYGIHCAKAHGKDDLRLPVFENCSKEMPVKPMPPPSHQHYRSVAHPSENNSNNAIFRPTGMSHRRNSHNGGGSDMIPSSNNTIYRSMNMRTMSDKISTKHRHHSDEGARAL